MSLHIVIVFFFFLLLMRTFKIYSLVLRSTLLLWLFFCLVAKSCLTLCYPMDIDCQAPPSVGFPRQEYWSGLSFPPPGDLPNPEIKPTAPALAWAFFTTELPGKPSTLFSSVQFSCSAVSDSLQPHESQYARPPCPSPTHVHWVGDAIQPSHPLSSPSPPAPNPFQHQSLLQWVNSSHEVAKVLEFQL